MPYLVRLRAATLMRLSAGRATEGPDDATAGRVADQGRQSSLPSLLSLGTDHPPDCGPLIAGRLGLEERPPFLIRSKGPLRRRIEVCSLLLFIAVDGRAFIGPSFEGFEPRGMHPPEPDQFLHARNVDRAPRAALRARAYPVRITDVVDAFADSVDPAEAQFLVDEVLPGDARFSRAPLVEPNEQLSRCRGVLLKPRAQLIGGGKEGRLHSRPE